ncbi:MAG: 30S ribosomal protein S1 [Syntrophaceae bacterium PtaU1.Bin231]|nr:MAG: 30S ribosomal protein S1 [Syntrophaceae bacterium PtaU1.Bin231]
MENQEQTDDKSFAELLAENEPEMDRMKPGQRVEAVIVKITPEWIFLDIGGKHEGHLDRKEMLDEAGALKVKEGDTVRAYFLSARQNEKLFTTKLSKGDAGRALLEDAWKSGIPVEGVVEKEIKGGFEIKIAGVARGFCPFSQMSITRVANAAEFVGKRLNFIILEYKERGRNVILSRRPILEEELKAKREALKATLREGMPIEGTVVSIQKFGAFVDIGGMQALLPISEIAWERIETVEDRLSVGQKVSTQIQKLDWEKNRISLSLKDTLPDPWQDVETAFPIGAVVGGKVARLANFGAFVTVAPGVDGLIHISKLGSGKKIKHASDVLKAGDEIRVQIEAVDREHRRLTLALSGKESAEPQGGGPDEYRSYVGKRGGFGSLGDLLRENGSSDSKETQN